LAPDSVNEIFDALVLMKKFTGKAYALNVDQSLTEKDWLFTGHMLLEEKNSIVDDLEIVAEGFENSRRKTVLQKVLPAYHIFKELVIFYGTSELMEFIARKNIVSFKELKDTLPTKVKRNKWINAGGQLLPENVLGVFIKNVTSGKIKSWKEVHTFYEKNSSIYPDQKMQHAFACLLELSGLTAAKFDKENFFSFLKQAADTKESMMKNIFDSREKDYHNEFKKMTYESLAEMEQVIGKLSDNVFIRQQAEELKSFKKLAATITKKFK